MASAEEQKKLEERARVMMADLSRLRQEELPLSSRETRGPSFNPTRKNGVGHIAPELKEKWKAQWNVEFDDEEARQCEGLAIDDSRPYAKGVVPPPPLKNPKGFADPGSASIAEQFPDSFKKNKKKGKGNQPKPQPRPQPPFPRSLRSAPSETGSTISASQPSWTARRMYAMSTRTNASPLRQPSSRVSRSVIASANDFLKSAAHEQMKKQNLQDITAPSENIQPDKDHFARSRSPLGASPPPPPPPQPQDILQFEESAALAIQHPSVALIDLDEESDADSQGDEKEELEHDIDEILRLLDLAKERMPVLVKSLDGGIPCEASTLVSLSTILGGLLQLRKSCQRTEEHGQAQQAPVTSSYNELMELVESVHPPRLCYDPDELLRLRDQAVLPSADTEALEQTKTAHKAFAAVRGAKSLEEMPTQFAEMSMHLAEIQHEVHAEETPKRGTFLAHSTQPSESSVDTLTTRTASWTLQDTPIRHEMVPTYGKTYTPTQGHPLFVLPPRLSCAVPIKADNPEAHLQVDSNNEVHNWPVKQVMETLARLDREDEEASRAETVSSVTPQSGNKGKKGLSSSMWA